MGIYRIFITILLFTGAICGQDQLYRYFKIALQNNPTLKAKTSEYLSALENSHQAGALPDPQLMAGALVQPVQTRNGPQQARISISQHFPWFGTQKTQKRIASAQAEALHATLEEEKSSLFYELSRVYFDLYVIEESLRQTDRTLKILDTLGRVLVLRIETGSASLVDRLKLEMEQADIQTKKSSLEDEKNVTSVRFNALMGVESSAVVDIPKQLWSIEHNETKETLWQEILQNNHQIQFLDQQKRVFEQKKRLASYNGWPNISLGLEYLIIGNSGNSMPLEHDGRDAIVFPVVGLSLPLHRGKYKAMAREAELMARAVTEKREALLNNLALMLAEADAQYRDAHRRITHYETQLHRADSALHVLETEYAAEGKQFTELLMMSTKRLQYALSREQGRADALTALARISYLRGRTKGEEK